jgi:nucleoside-diphosphate-sugar epimerase
MRVLLTGASGFIGCRLAQSLRATGEQVVCAMRSPPRGELAGHCGEWVPVDFERDVEPGAWEPRLARVDAVINAVGILREHGSATFESIHVRAPQALFRACLATGVRRVIQVSALGADEHAVSLYHLSKRRADDFLAGLPLDWTIVQPSLVYGPGGASARLLTGMASLPVVALPGRGEQRVQPIHVDDVVESILLLLTKHAGIGMRIPFVGPEPVTLRSALTDLRVGMGLGPPRLLAVPLGLVGVVSRIGAISRRSLLDPATFAMLMRGNTGPTESIREVLQRMPRRVRDFIPPQDAASVRTAAQLQWLLPMLRWSIAAVWIATGIISFGLYPQARSFELLARVGIGASLAPLFLYGAAAMDLILGLATLVMRHRRWLWLVQIAAIAGYTILISWRMPEFWLHPFGPLLKNVPMLAAIFTLYQLERR